MNFNMIKKNFLLVFSLTKNGEMQKSHYEKNIKISYNNMISYNYVFISTVTILSVIQ